eukprot:gene5009-5500_t
MKDTIPTMLKSSIEAVLPQSTQSQSQSQSLSQSLSQSQPPNTINCIELVHQYKYLVGIGLNQNVFHLSGFGQFTLLKGLVIINGYIAKPYEVLPFHCPAWQATIRSSVPSSNQNLEGEDIHYEGVTAFAMKNLAKCSTAIFIIEGIPKEKQEWLIAIEDQDFYSSPFKGQRMKKNSIFTPDILRFSSGCLGSTESLSENCGLSLTHLPTSWVSSVSHILGQCKTDSKESVKVMICGAKGVGKSTLSRYCLNRLVGELSANSVVYYLNCDLGQPEFNPPGYLALHLIDRAVLSSSHLLAHDHFSFLKLSTPCEATNESSSGQLSSMMAYFIGDLTSRHEPELFMGALQDIMRFYDERCIEHEKLNKKTHLIVNTDGFIRYMGAEILNAIFNAVKPAHVLHISRHAGGDLPFHYDSDIKFPVNYQPVEEGRSVPSRIKAADLRNLRILSYFLRDHPLLSATIDANMSIKLVSSSFHGNGQAVLRRKQVLDEIAIKSGGLVGGENGNLALAMLTMAPFILPFHKIVFNGIVQSPDLSPAMLLAACNMNMCSISVVDLVDIPTDSVRQANLISASGEKFFIRHLSKTVLKPAVGLAMVRAVDTGLQHLVLTSPQPLPSLIEEGSDKVILLSLSAVLRMPNQLCTGTHFPSYPYFTTELTGEGSTPLRPRPNKRRRGN